jgi:beta-glucanase (GH16 family)
MYLTSRKALALLALAGTSLAQTHSDCDPTKQTDCPPNTALGVANYTIDFEKNMMSSRVWNTTAGTIDYSDDGAEFTINAKGDSPTVKSRFYIFFGQLEVIMKAAPGQGVVSSIVLLSDALDEIDWEWIGGNTTHVQSNFFAKGKPDFKNAIWHPVSSPQTEWHNYTVNWQQDKIEWYIDTQLMRSLTFDEADGGKAFPQTPSDVRLGIWAGGDPDNPEGTIEWSGGEIDYDQGPYTQLVKSVRVTDHSLGSTQYIYGDQTGTFESIRAVDTAPALKLDGENSEGAAQTAQQKWNGMSKTTKIIIASVVVGVFVIAVLVFAFCCIRQRRAGKHERLLEDAKFEKNQSELLAYRAEMSRMRSEKLAEARSMGIPSPGANMHMGASYMSPTSAHGTPQMVNPGLDPRNQWGASNGYAQSVSSYGSRGGYQRY